MIEKCPYSLNKKLKLRKNNTESYKQTEKAVYAPNMIAETNLICIFKFFKISFPIT